MLTRALRLTNAAFVFVALLPACAFAASYHPPSYYGSGSRFAQAGVVDRIDYRFEDFDLVANSDTYAIHADHCTIQLSGSRLGNLRDLRNGAYVRVIGDRLSERTARANRIIVLDESGKFKPGGNRYRQSDKTQLMGCVTRVFPRYSEINVRAQSESYVIVVRPSTVIRRYIYATDIYDIGEGDNLSVVGTISGTARIYAERIQIVSSNKGPRYDASDRDREDRIEGVVTYPAASFDRTFAIQTDYGERKVDVPRSADVIKDGRSARVQDLRKGDRVRAYGTWDGSTLVATRVETIDRLAARDYEPAPERPADEQGADQPPTYEPEPAANEPRVDQPDQEPEGKPSEPPEVTSNGQEVADQAPTGRIVSIDYDKVEMTIDVDMSDVKVDAANAAITRKGSMRRFSDLEKGDKVAVTGDYADGVLKAAAIEIVD